MVYKVLVVTTFGSWDTGLFLPRKKEALGCGITKPCYSVRNNGLHWAACFVITSHWWLVTDTTTKVWLEFLKAETSASAKPYWSVQFPGGLNPVSKGEIMIWASRLFPLCCLPYGLARSKPATPRPWSHCTQQLGSTRRPVPGPSRALVSNFLYISPLPHSHRTLDVFTPWSLCFFQISVAGIWGARCPGLPGQCLGHCPEDLVFMLAEIQYLVWQTRAGCPSPWHIHIRCLPCAQSLDTCIHLEHEHLEVSLTLDFKEPAMVITTQFQGASFKRASFRGSWFPLKHALVFVQSCSTWPLL